MIIWNVQSMFDASKSCVIFLKKTFLMLIKATLLKR